MLICLGALLLSATTVDAHDWYSGIQNPVTGFGCCGGKDCHPLMLDELGRLTENDDNFIIDGKWYFPKAEAMPAKGGRDHNDFRDSGAPADGRVESGYSYCIWGGKARCFFYPLGT